MLRDERQSVRMSKITNDIQLNSVWHMLLYSCTYMTTVGVRGFVLHDITLSVLTPGVCE